MAVKKFYNHIAPFSRLVFASMLAGLAWAAHAASTSLEEAHEALKNDRSYVFDYAVREVQQSRPRTARSNSGFFDSLGGILEVVFWAAVIIAIGLLLFFIIAEAIRLSKIERGAEEIKTAKPEIIPNYQPEAQAAKSLLGDVDELAAQGRYEEAIHTLLLRSISDIRENRPKAVPKAMTSREISHISILSELARQAFRNIGDRVERSYFGGRKLSKDDFERSRADYETFAFERKQTS